MRKSSPLLIVLLALLVTFAIASPAAADYASVSGQLRNNNGGPYAYGGTITIYDCDTLATITTGTVTPPASTFTIPLPNPPAAPYKICVLVDFNPDTTLGYDPGNQTKGEFPNFAASSGSLNVGAFTAEAPLSVRLSSLTASPSASQIKVQWTSASEVNNLGFNVYRSTSAEAPSQPLNSALIASQAAGSSESFAYEWVDGAVQAGVTYYYWLEDVDASGERTMSGPVSAAPEAPTAVELNTLSATATPMAGTLPLLGLGLVGLAAAAVAWRRRR